MESKVYARENKNDGPMELKEERRNHERQQKHGRTNGSQVLVESKKYTDEVRESKLEKGNG